MNEFADTLRKIGVDDATTHDLARRKAIYDLMDLDRRCKEEPDIVVAELQEAARAYLGADYDFKPHFTPRYRPWQQRLAFVPDGDMFVSIAQGKAEVVTDEIERFTETGILLKSGKVLDADIIATATGFNLLVMGGIPFDVDGKRINWAETINYRGVMFTGVPNMAWIFGYFRAAWTLRVDMLGDFMCRLFNHMDKKGVKVVEVTLRPEDKDMEILPWISEDNFNPGYLMRGLHLLPKRGAKPEWQHNQDYWHERDEFPAIDLDGAEFVYR